MVYNGAVWSARAEIDGSHQLDSVSCTTASFCVAVDRSGNALSYAGRAWSAPVSVDSGHSLSAVSCASASFCAAVDTGGRTPSYNDGTWSAPVRLDSGHSFSAISCASTTFCLAVDANAYYATFDGAAWSAAQPMVIEQLTSVSCPSASFCTAVNDGNGWAPTYDGSGWTGGQLASAEQNGQLRAVSCASSSFCMTVDNDGNAVVYDASASPPPISPPPPLPGSPPVSSSAPVISGSPVSGAMLTEAHGSWTNEPSFFSYRWERCDATGAHCAAITDATSQAYEVSVCGRGAHAASPGGRGEHERRRRDRYLDADGRGDQRSKRSLERARCDRPGCDGQAAAQTRPPARDLRRMGGRSPQDRLVRRASRGASPPPRRHRKPELESPGGHGAGDADRNPRPSAPPHAHASRRDLCDRHVHASRKECNKPDQAVHAQAVTAAESPLTASAASNQLRSTGRSQRRTRSRFPPITRSLHGSGLIRVVPGSIPVAMRRPRLLSSTPEFDDGHDRGRGDAPAGLGPVMAVVNSGVPAPEATVEAPKSLASGRRASSLTRGRARHVDSVTNRNGMPGGPASRRSGTAAFG